MTEKTVNNETQTSYSLTKAQARTVFNALNNLSGVVDKQLKENAAAEGKWNNYLESQRRSLIKRRDEVSELKKLFDKR
ncbi:hypothetical protein L3081_24015 [Colwellia sp. MSW7]|uniref:Uncharacterized protein n=1 Tax=Colwellia maritima TaxID=2912588 RepID=A0ABS9X6P7_9GAMM|nr:hypothetical protein [Colwellia maritima]MCI2285894.1 hypothetical protein [Colwellia maritima]